MSTTRIVTLFGEEITPDPPQPPGRKTRGKKKEQEESDGNEGAANEPAINAGEAETTAEVSTENVAEQTQGPVAETVQQEPVHIAEAASQEVVNTEEVAPQQRPVNTAELKPAQEVANAVEEEPKPPVVDRRKLLAAIRQTETKAEKTARKEKAAEEAILKEAPVIIPEDWTGDKKYYTIGEVAALFSVKTSHIRFWTNEFKLKVRTTRKGDRLFTPEQVKELRTIYHLVKERGFTLTGAKTKLKTQNKRDVTTIDLKDSLIALRDKLQILRDQL